MSFVIIEYNDITYVNLIIEPDGCGTVKVFDTEPKAERWAKKNIAFNYKIVRLY